MATHSSVLAWRIPGTEQPGGLPSMWLHRVGHNWRDLAAAAAASRCWGVRDIMLRWKLLIEKLDEGEKVSRVLISSVPQLCPIPCDLMDCSMPGFSSSPTPGVCSKLYLSSWWCHPAISSSVVPFSSCLQSLPASESFLSQFFASGGQSIGVSASASVQYSGLIFFRIDWFDLLAVQGTLKSSPMPQFKSINSSVLSFLYSPTLTSICDYWKNHSFD